MSPPKRKRQGFRYALGSVFKRIVPAWLFRYRKVVVFEMKGCSPPAPPNNSLKIGWCHSKEELETAEDLSLFSRDQLADEINGSLMACLAIGDRDARLGAAWVASDIFLEPELGLRYELSPSQAWLCNTRVIEDARQLGVYTQMLGFLVQQLDGMGLNQILAAVSPYNKASAHVHRKYAKRELGEITVWRFLAVTYCRAKGDIACQQKFSFDSKSEPIEIQFEGSGVRAPNFLDRSAVDDSRVIDSVEV